MWSLVVVVLLLTLIFLGFPIAISVGVLIILVFLAKGSIPFASIPQYLYESTANYAFIAAPLFLLAGQFMEEGGISRRLVDVGLVLVGRFRGGLGHATIVASMFMGGISGSAVADTSAIGSITIPSMVNRGYPKGFACATLALCGAVGVIIPPSIPMVVLSTMTGLSVGGLFLGGVIPGVVTGFAMMISTYFIARKLKFPTEPPISWRKIVKIFYNALPTLIIPVFVVAGILGGVFTVTEISAVVALYCFILGAFGYRELKISRIPKMLLRTVEIVGSLLIVLAFCGVMAWLVVYENIPDKLAASILTVTTNKTIMLILIIFILLILGCVMDMVPNIVITAPVLLPLINKLGIDPMYFGVLMIYVLAIGLITPPVGATLFVSCAIGEIPQHASYSYIFLFVLLCTGITILLIIFPQLIMFLPNLILAKSI